MSDSRTIARPYAKAIFEFALARGQLVEWSEYLHSLALLVEDPELAQFINNPASSVSQHCELLASIATLRGNKADDDVKNLISTLAQNKRILVLPEIRTLYEAMRSEQEKTITVNVFSYSPLSTSKQQQLAESLSARLQRHVTLDVIIDSTLMGGIVIQAGDLVIDGSVRGKLNKLRTGLAA